MKNIQISKAADRVFTYTVRQAGELVTIHRPLLDILARAETVQLVKALAPSDAPNRLPRAFRAKVTVAGHTVVGDVSSPVIPGDFSRLLGLALRTPIHEVTRYLEELGLTDVCPRCGGTGFTIWTHVHDGVCFKCSGGGRARISLSPRTWIDLVTRCDSGRLPDPHATQTIDRRSEDPSTGLEDDDLVPA